MRSFGRNLFDFHAARRRRHEHGLALRAIEHDAEIQLAFDGQCLFDQQPLHDAAFRSGLVRDQRHAENLLRDLNRFGRILGDLDAAAFAASAGVDLRLHDDAAADFLRCGFRLFDGVCHFASWHRDAVLGQDRLGLIFVNFHGQR